MEFKLFYHGPVESFEDASPEHIHSLRKHFHHQLNNLWSLEPLKSHRNWRISDKTLTKEVDKKKFAFLVSKKLDMYAELSFDMLIPKGVDILKT